MMRLIVVRHAKSSWSNPALNDHDRPLSPRGERSSALIGKWLADRSLTPGHVLCSTSRRTRETWAGISRHVGAPASVEFVPELYHAGLGDVAACMTLAVHSPAMLIGHNPGIGYFADWILDQQPAHPDFHRYPTGATLVCQLQENVSGSALRGAAQLVDFVVPRDLE